LINWFIDNNKETLNERVLNPLKELLFNVEKMDFLIKGILAYSSIDKSELEDRPINLNFVIDEVLKTILIPLNIKITVQENLSILH
tara:strand:- start:1508 stop:1765 length:258 start_codon:yes stop_codon:yes gene_type:complete